MKQRQNNFFWGIALILVGGFFLAINVGWIPELSELMWPIVLALLSAVFFVAYFFGENRNWGLLFPAVGTGAAAITIWLARANVEGTIIGGLFMLLISIPFWVGFLANRRANWGLLIPAWIVAAIGLIVMLVDEIQGETIGALVMFSIALPFIVVYLLDRKNWWALIPAWAMTVVGVIVLMANNAAGELIGALVMFSIALPFIVVYFLNREHWWALIPGWVTAVIGVIVLLADNVNGEFIGALVMFSIALPFMVVYFLNRKHRWALIPGWVTAVIGVIILLSRGGTGELIGGLVLFSIALPFFIIFLADRNNWWALIPAGALVSIGLITTLAGIELAESIQVRLLGGVLFAGLAVTFAAIWYLRSHQETDWAKYPAAGLGAAALMVITFGAQVELVWSALLIGAGLWLIVRRSSLPKEKSPEIFD